MPENNGPSHASNGSLFLVATPIGNLEDITLRALRILKEVDFIAAEDTRHTKKLLAHYGIHTKLLSYYREQEVQKAEHILNLLQSGHDIALVTDAGTPCIADPGTVVLQKARAIGITIVPVPGPSALSTALSCAGIDERGVMFYGFAPAKKSQRRKILQSLIHADYYSVFYESPHRIEAFVKEGCEILGDRRIFMARELTKSYEELMETSLSQLLEKLGSGKIRGEFVLVFWPAETSPSGTLDVDELIRWYRDNAKVSLKDCCRKLSADLGISRSKVYKRALQIWQETPENQ